jgi:hypothetical protein
MDRYFLQAHLMPALLTAVPVLVFYHAFFNAHIEAVLANMHLLTQGTGLTFSVALVFLWVQLNKLSGRLVFQKLIFNDELRMPTTDHLLYRNKHFTPETKRLIRNKIESHFQLRLYTYKKEGRQEENARKQICLAVSQIREHLRSNKMLLRHNIDYGFFKNLVSGSLLALLFSVAGALLAPQLPLLKPFTSLYYILTGIYLFPVLFSRGILRHFGHYYSKTLYEQFLVNTH